MLLSHDPPIAHTQGEGIGQPPLSPKNTMAGRSAQGILRLPALRSHQAMAEYMMESGASSKALAALM